MKKKHFQDLGLWKTLLLVSCGFIPSRQERGHSTRTQLEKLNEYKLFFWGGELLVSVWGKVWELETELWTKIPETPIHFSGTTNFCGLKNEFTSHHFEIGVLESPMCEFDTLSNHQTVVKSRDSRLNFYEGPILTTSLFPNMETVWRKSRSVWRVVVVIRWLLRVVKPIFPWRESKWVQEGEWTLTTRRPHRNERGHVRKRVWYRSSQVSIDGKYTWVFTPPSQVSCCGGMEITGSFDFGVDRQKSRSTVGFVSLSCHSDYWFCDIKEKYCWWPS